jgi:hypothetical protein
MDPLSTIVQMRRLLISIAGVLEPALLQAVAVL